jgi:large subunit ribosomal protein L21
MLAVMKTGGKQYKISKGDFVSVEKLQCEVGSSIEIKDVLMIEDNGKVVVGKPTIAGATVLASIVEQKKHGTVLIFKKSRRNIYRRKNGHRHCATIL